MCRCGTKGRGVGQVGGRPWILPPGFHDSTPVTAWSGNHPAEFSPAKCWVSSSSPPLLLQGALSTLWTLIKLFVIKDLDLCSERHRVICLELFYFGYFSLKQAQHGRENAWTMPKRSSMIFISPWMYYEFVHKSFSDVIFLFVSVRKSLASLCSESKTFK